MSHLISRRNFIASSFFSTILPCVSIRESFGNSIESSSFQPFSFVFISDCHLTSGLADNFMLLQESQLFLQEAIKQINSLSPDFVIFGGDQVQGIGDSEVHWQLFLDILQSLECPWYFVLGETDISGNILIDKMRVFGRDWKGRGLNNDVSYWSCNPLPGLHLIGLDTSQANSVTGDIDQAQLDWLRKDVSQNAAKVNIIVSHHPICAPDSINDNSFYLLPQSQAVREILEKAPGHVVSINGHVHLSQIQWQNKVCYISSPSLDIYPCAFRFFKFTEDEMLVNTYEVNFPALVKKAKVNIANSRLPDELLLKKKNDIIRLATGNKQDKDARFSLKEAGN